jgi:hypothetical protein
MIKLVLLFLCYVNINFSLISFEIIELTNNNTGPFNRGTPVFTCYPALNDIFPKCFAASGQYSDVNDTPNIFYNDVWRMDIDIETKTVNWTQLPFDNPPQTSAGGFFQYWKKNVTAFSWTAGINFFNATSFQIFCDGSQIVTYDYQNLRFEVTQPIGNYWKNISSGACGKYKDDVYCFGGFNCTNFDQPLLWTKYNIPTNTLTQLNSAGLANIQPRTSNTLTCIKSESKCILGEGENVILGKINQWAIYSIKSDSWISFNSSSQPINLKYVKPDISENWKIYDGNYKVKSNKKMFMSAGDNGTTGDQGLTNTIRYLALFDYDTLQFNPQPIDDLFTIKQQSLSAIPFALSDDNDDNDDNENICRYFVEWGGREQNTQVPFHYPNTPVLYKVC